MPIAKTRALSLYYEQDGPEEGPVVMLIQGLSATMAAWPQDLINALVSYGYHVIRFDNRDVGRSARWSLAEQPSLPLQWLYAQFGWFIDHPYTLAEMAQDAVDLMDTLAIKQAHVLGVSMGGMIAQHIASRYPQRVVSLTSVMSSSGYSALPGPTRAAYLATTQGAPKDAGREALIQKEMAMWRVLGSQSKPRPGDDLRTFVEVQLDWAPPAGAGGERQLLAIIGDGSRCAQLHTITAPTLVIHGDEDPLVPVAAGHHTASQIGDAQMKVVPGMGHDWPDAFVPIIWPMLDEHFTRADSVVRERAA